MKLQTTMPLLFLLMLSGCNLQDLGLEDKKSTPTAEVVTSTELKAFLDGFVLLQNQELMLDKLAIDLQGDDVSSVAGASTTTSETGVCGGTADLTTDLTGTTVFFDNVLSLSAYCNDSPDLQGFTGKLIETGDVSMVGTDPDGDVPVYTLSFPSYIYEVVNTSPFRVTLLGSQRVTNNTTTKSLTRYSDSIQVTQTATGSSAFSVSAQQWLVASYTAGRIYTGSMTLPVYGTVDVSTVSGSPVVTTPNGATKIPVSGQLKMVGVDSIGYITFEGPSSYTLEVDSNADGTIDLTETLSW